MTRQPPVSVGLDGFNLALQHGTGVATYARALSFCLKGLGHSVDVLYGMHLRYAKTAAMREVLFFEALSHNIGESNKTWRRELGRRLMLPRARPARQVDIAGTVQTRSLEYRMPAYDRILNSNIVFALCQKYFQRYGRFLPVRVPDPPAIMHWTYPLPVRVLGSKNIYTVHDLVPLRLPFTSAEDKRYHYRLMRECLRHEHIVTVSDYSRNDILRFFPEARPDRVTNCYQAVTLKASDEDFSPEEASHKLKSLFGLERESYFLFFGAVEPKKNLGRLIEAFLATDIKAKLVIVGAPGWHGDDELRLLKSMQQGKLAGAKRIKQLDYLPRPLLNLLIRNARGVVFPSIFEGFGLPVLEAMSLGTPVLTSNVTSLPEIAGDSAILIDPYSVAAIREGLITLDNDSDMRARLATNGRLRAAHFSMDNYARRLTSLYQNVMAGAPSGRPVGAGEAPPSSAEPSERFA